MAIATLRSLSYAYPAEARVALDRVDLDLEGGLTLVAGASGGGKSTLLRTLNGLVPHFHGGRVAGQAEVAGLDVLRTPTRRLARSVGFVFQDPEQQTVYTAVEREVAFGLENVGLPAAEMGARVEEAMARAGISHLRGRRLPTLSGGERQRVAVAAALALRPALLVLDEPTAQLDAEGGEQVLAACLELAREQAVVVAEHRLERLLPAAQRAVLVAGGAVECGPPAALAGRLPAAPAIVRLGVRLGWDPLPLALADAAGRAPSLRPGPPRPPVAGRVAWSLAGVAAGHGGIAAVEDAELAGREGEVVVLMGPNGGGKTTLLRAIGGLAAPLAGRAERRPGRVAYLPQNPTALLHRPSVRKEVELTLARAGDGAETADEVLARFGLVAEAERYPRDLSSGQRQRVALAAVLAGNPTVVLLDEPTRGMDASARASLVAAVRHAAERGAAVVLATHDSDLAGELGDRVVRVGRGRAEDLGPPERALAGDTPLATQIGRLYPEGPVTVEGVLARL